MPNKAVLETEKERDELHNQIEQIEEQLHPKRARTHDDVGDADEMLAEVDNWDLSVHMLVDQHFRAIICNKDWDMDHTDMKIQQVVVMYLNDDQISRPPALPIVSPSKGIMSCYSFIFLGVPRHYDRRSFSCWCKACSRVRGRGHGWNSCDANLMVQGYTRTKQTF